VDFVAQSFVRTAEDVRALRQAMQNSGGAAPIIAKIEKAEAVDNFGEILAASDGVMVARGDLGVEASLAKVPIYQKHIITQSNQAAKPVITATQMLDSMTWNARPTRAEVSDVANAVLDGTDAVMLSGETAVGRDPVNVVQTMACIVEVAEGDFPYEVWAREAAQLRARTVVDAISQTACEMAEELSAAAIICPTRSGRTARLVARYRPKAPIVATTPNPATYHQLALVWGVRARLVEPGAGTDESIQRAVSTAAGELGLKSGDTVVITAGVPFEEGADTNMVQVKTLP
jgi:pyruvate kinase